MNDSQSWSFGTWRKFESLGSPEKATANSGCCTMVCARNVSNMAMIFSRRQVLQMMQELAGFKAMGTYETAIE